MPAGGIRAHKSMCSDMPLIRPRDAAESCVRAAVRESGPGRKSLSALLFGRPARTLARRADVTAADIREPRADHDLSQPKRKPAAVDPEAVPKAVVSRLSLYLRELQLLLREGQATVSSSQLGQLLGFTDAQVRKDLAYFGHFGHPGIGYRCDELVAAIRSILGTDREWTIAMVGVGNLGRALLGYRGFSSQGFRIVAAFDQDPARVNQTIEGVDVYPMMRLDEIIRAKDISFGMLAVPAAAAQGVADVLVAAGVSGVLNFAPVTLSLPPGVSLVGVDLATELERLSFSVANRPEDRPAGDEKTP